MATDSNSKATKLPQPFDFHMGSGDHAFYFQLRHTASLILGTPLILTSTPFWLVFSTYIDHSISVPAASQGEGEGYWINIDSKTLQITIVVHYISRQNLTWNKYLGLKALSKVHWKPKDLHLVCFSSFTIRDGSNICFRTIYPSIYHVVHNKKKPIRLHMCWVHSCLICHAGKIWFAIVLRHGFLEGRLTMMQLSKGHDELWWKLHQRTEQMA
jgi:hypothetical protein